MKTRNILALSLLFASGILMQSCTGGMADVETGNVTEIQATTADISGHIISVGDGIKRYGHCWSQDNTPTISDSYTIYSVAIGEGTYSSHLINLLPGTTYYARAYVISGNFTVYGSEVSFTTGSQGR